MFKRMTYKQCFFSNLKKWFLCNFVCIDVSHKIRSWRLPKNMFQFVLLNKYKISSFLYLLKQEQNTLNFTLLKKWYHKLIHCDHQTFYYYLNYHRRWNKSNARQRRPKRSAPVHLRVRNRQRLPDVHLHRARNLQGLQRTEIRDQNRQQPDWSRFFCWTRLIDQVLWYFFWSSKEYVNDVFIKKLFHRQT